MKAENVLCVIMGGGRGTRLYPFTQFRCKPAVPLAGKYRLVDIPISNCLNAGYSCIYLLTQFNTESLHRHINETYRFDHFGNGFVEILSAEQTVFDDSWYLGTADAVRQNLRHIPMRDDTLMVILSGDQLYRMDLKALVDQHQKYEDDVTIAAKVMPLSQAGSFGILRLGDDCKIIDFVEKPQEPELVQSLALPEELKTKLSLLPGNEVCLVSMGIYVFKASVLKQVLNETALHDFGHDVLPSLLGKVPMRSYFFEGYWEDIGTVASFFDANLMLTDALPAFNFFDEDNPIYTRARYLPSSKLNSCSAEKCNVAEGCIISQAELRRCVIGTRSIIRENSQMENVIMMGADHFETFADQERNQRENRPNIGVGQNCYIRNAILDRNVRVGNNVRLSPEGKPDNFEQGSIFIRDGILCVAKNGIVPDNTIF